MSKGAGNSFQDSRQRVKPPGKPPAKAEGRKHRHFFGLDVTESGKVAPELVLGYRFGLGLRPGCPGTQKLVPAPATRLNALGHRQSSTLIRNHRQARIQATGSQDRQKLPSSRFQTSLLLLPSTFSQYLFLELINPKMNLTFN